MKICFLVPDGTGIRNYLYSRLISEFPKNTEILLWHNLSEKVIDEVRMIHSGVNIIEERIPVYVENFRERILREASTYARLHWNAKTADNNTILYFWPKPQKSLKRKILFGLAEVIGGRIKNNYQKIRKMEEKHTGLISRTTTLEPYLRFLSQHKPDVVFCTHQRVPWLLPVMEAARKLRIKTVTAIYSWDNIPKAKLLLRTDKFIVWSQFMKEELHQFYPEIQLDDIEVTGTPQFEFYKENSRIWSRENFTRRFNLDPQKRFICYSGDDITTSPYDPRYLKDIAEAVNAIEPSDRPHIIFRRSPADFSNRYDDVLKEHHAIITSIDPLWQCDGKNTEWMAFYPLPEDVDLLVNLAHHCDLSVNIGSTIAHDFATLGKPTYYIKYDQETANGWNVDLIYQLQHFRSMNGFAAVGWINSKREIKKSILNALHRPATIGKDSHKWLNKIVSEDYEHSSRRIAQYISSVCT